MERVISQLGETKDPKLFNKKMNILLDLFDKWEVNMISRESALLEKSHKTPEKHYCSQTKQQELAQLQQQKELKERTILVEQKETELLAEKVRLENILLELNVHQMEMEKKLTIISAQKQEKEERKVRRENMQSRITEKTQQLAEYRDLYYQRLARLEEQQLGMNKERDKIKNDRQNVMNQAENIKSAEYEKQKLQQQLKEYQEQIMEMNLILEKKYQSLNNMHQHQIYKQAIDQREQALKLKEENIKLLSKELAAIKNTQIMKKQMVNQQQKAIEQSQYQQGQQQQTLGSMVRIHQEDFPTLAASSKKIKSQFKIDHHYDYSLNEDQKNQSITPQKTNQIISNVPANYGIIQSANLNNNTQIEQFQDNSQILLQRETPDRYYQVEQLQQYQQLQQQYL